MSNSKGHRPV